METLRISSSFILIALLLIITVTFGAKHDAEESSGALPFPTLRPRTTTTTPTTTRPSRITTIRPRPTTRPTSTTTTSRPTTRDPLHVSPEGEQLQCSNVGEDCTSCQYIDWVKIQNKTVSRSFPYLSAFEDITEENCFKQCNATLSCVIFVHNKVTNKCKIYDKLYFEHVREDQDYSLFTRVSPRFKFINEWIVSLNTVPRGEPLDSQTVSNFLNCTLLCGYHSSCVFATFDRNDMTCSLYSRLAAQFTGLKANQVSIQHMSLFKNDNSWRFQDQGHIYQRDPPSIQYTTETREGCLEGSYAFDSCLLATTKTTGQNAVECSLYENYQNVWEQDDPSTNYINSFYKLVQRNNTLFRRYAPYITVGPRAEHSSLIETFESISLLDCQERALNLNYPETYWLTYNSSSETCKIYDLSAPLYKYREVENYEMSLHFRSIPTDYLQYYGFDGFWVHNVSEPGDINVGPEVKGHDCLGLCLDMEECGAVSIQKPELNCTFFTQAALDRIVSAHNEINNIGEQPMKVFTKSLSPNFVVSSAQYSCSSKPFAGSTRATFQGLNKVNNEDFSFLRNAGLSFQGGN